MLTRTPWVERKFSFDFPEGWIYNILERLEGTSARLKEMTWNQSHEMLEARHGQKWSIKEHIGHLGDLEELHEGRIDDFLLRKEILRPADMTNQKTESAEHNSRNIDELIESFRLKRNQFISRLRALDGDTHLFRAIHPRLQVRMRPVDVAFFTAEHDDHHLATIRMILDQTITQQTD